MTTTIRVELGNRSYPIHVGAGLLAERELFLASTTSDQVIILTNDTIAPLYLDRVCANFEDRSCHTLILPDGEAHKTLESFARIITFMLERRIERSASLIALGGGVIGDLGGFAAACYQRGIRYVQVPTSLLAQVDSSVGGKTAVNHPLGKNMIGAFHQPNGVIADTETLNTLPDRELHAGFAEIIKYGLIRDYPFFKWLEDHVDGLLQRSPDTLGHAIRRSCENKAEIVAADEREANVRATLNLGHTFGHAIETVLGYGAWLHGEAVAAGMCMAARLSASLGSLSRDDVVRIESLLRKSGLPVAAPREISPEALLDVMRGDKKNVGGRIRLVLLESLGSARISVDYADELLVDTLAREPLIGW
jgi:3-dehydroquinate synthase